MKIMQKESYFVPVTASTVSWDPHDAFPTANLPHLHLSRPIQLLNLILSPWVRVMCNESYQMKIALSRSPRRELSNGIKFVNFHRHLSVFPFSI
jgi:hypothetical protein